MWGHATAYTDIPMGNITILPQYYVQWICRIFKRRINGKRMYNQEARGVYGERGEVLFYGLWIVHM